MASALRATWVSTWPRVHPAHSESAAWSPSRIPYAVSNRAAVAAWTPGVLEESVANLYGYELLNDARVDGAVALFRLIVAVFPDSANANDSLADGLVAAGDTAGAIKWHRKLFPLCRDMLGLSSNPIPLKAAMKMLNRDTGDVRLPMTPLDEASVGKLRKTLAAYGLL